MPLPTEILATPTKRFFVEMLTRDIDLDEAILDLLDNCVDGVLRVNGYHPEVGRPYRNYGAQLKFTGQEFVISDNCGGIPEDIITTAFLLGRPFGMREDNDVPTVGLYGIGMKRAIFKLGRECTVISRGKRSGFSVTFPEKWFTSEKEWGLEVAAVPGDPKNPGTTITVRRLHEEIVPGLVESGGSRLSARYATCSC